MATTTRPKQRPRRATGKAGAEADGARQALPADRPTRARSMIQYRDVDGRTPEGQRTAAGLLRLKGAIEKHVPPKLVDGNFLLATWNIRELGAGKFGGRSEEALHYIAEIISAFDAVAIEEVRADVREFKRIQALLGEWWRYMVTDITVGHRGNHERLGFLYDSRKIRFSGLASQVVIPPVEKGKKRTASTQLARTPFMLGMQAGWFRFTICAAHVLWGKSVADDQERIDEIDSLATFLRERAHDAFAWSENMIALGDFNIFSTEDETFKRLEKQGFQVPRGVMNIQRNRHYDQIAFLAPYLEKRRDLDRSRAGMFPVYDHVFREPAEDGTVDPGRDRDLQAYAAAMKAKLPDAADAAARKKFLRSFRLWRTYQISDHLPLWIELDTDFSRGYLANRMRGARGPSSGPRAPAAARRRATGA